MDSLDERPAKRRRTSRSPPPRTQPSALRTRTFDLHALSGYVGIAATRVDLKHVDGVAAAALERHGEDHVAADVTLVADEAEPNHHRIHFEIRGVGKSVKKATGHVVIPQENSLRILRDAAVLEPSSKIAGKRATGSGGSAALPLACSHATLVHIHGEGTYRLEVQILWQDTPFIRDRVNPSLLRVLRSYLPMQNPEAEPSPSPEDWEPRQFYDNVHVPAKSPENTAEIPIPWLQTQLYPFQRRAVRWLLRREGVMVSSNGAVAKINDDEDQREDLPRGYETCQTVSGERCNVNHALGVVSTDRDAIKKYYSSINGGILADEMGLGKTLEIIALICLHRRPDISPQGSDSSDFKKSGATLIITPPTLVQQWKQELREHAPSLKICEYDGVASFKKKGDKAVEELASYDVVITTYNTIGREIHFVVEQPQRHLRNRPRAEPPKSPLVQMSWWRVCLDEAQMVESGVSKAATVARLIPRVNAWAVTGTPLRKGHHDLFGLILFLRYEPWCQSTRIWDHLVDYHRPMFRSLMGEIAMRHSKDFVREDLRLPPQSRHTITIPFTPIEEQHYDQLFVNLCEEVGLDRYGAPLHGDWDPDAQAEAMRTWLTRLRQTCLHPEVGSKNRKALGRSHGALRTVQQVLDAMIEQNEGQVRTVQRSYLLSAIRRGQLQENAQDTQAAMEIWKAAYDEATRIVSECRQTLQNESAKLSSADGNSSEEDLKEDGDSVLLGLRQRLRSFLEVQHICIFFIANAYFQLKSDESKIKPESEEYHDLEQKETASYEEAKAIRGELLVEVLRKANKLITSVKEKDSTDKLVSIPEMKFSNDYTGIESRRIYGRLYDYCAAMNEQAAQYRELRQKMVEFLRRALIDEDEGVELQGDEYENSTKLQDEMYAYMELLRALYADRSDAMSGQENLLIRQEMNQFLNLAKEGNGPAPELMIQLLAKREEKRVKVDEMGSLRGILSEARALVNTLQLQADSDNQRAHAELKLATEIFQSIQQINVAQSRTLSSLEQEVNLFRDTMNSRLDYYRALQKISDTVAPFEEDNLGNPLNSQVYNQYLTREVPMKEKISSLSAKSRYLQNLKTESTSSTPRICTICQCDFEIGTLTVCGHQFCKECIQLWWQAHKNCPICKRRLHPHDFHDISYKPSELAVQAESPGSSPGSSRTDSDKSHNQSIYSDISLATLNQIKNTELRGPNFGSKVDFLCRHLIWLRENDPGCKAIIFSQYREFIDFLSRAFKDNRISFSRFDDKNGIENFKSDPAVECFLLHAKAHSTGLNLVVASHVFLCEPLINTAIELQAIARVHRIGQHSPTTVWMYLIADSVEESIYEISVARRLAHLKSNLERHNSKAKGQSRSGTATPAALQENALDAANSMEIQAADLSKMLTSGKSGGELVDKDDLWPCLFGRIKKREQVMNMLAPERLPASSEVGRFLRAEAADQRQG